jgi:hypothetical protein
MGLKERITKSFQDLGLDRKDIPRAIVVHELLGITLLIVTMGTCWILQPSKNPVIRQGIVNVAKLLPESVRSSYQNSNVLNNKMTTAYLESSCLRKIIRPITLPGKMIVTYKVVRKLSEYEKRNSNMAISYHKDKMCTSRSRLSEIMFMITGEVNPSCLL